MFVTRQFREHVLKVAMIWAALGHSETINPHHMQAAVSFGEFLLESTLRIFFADTVPRMGTTGRE